MRKRLGRPVANQLPIDVIMHNICAFLVQKSPGEEGGIRLDATIGDYCWCQDMASPRTSRDRRS